MLRDVAIVGAAVAVLQFTGAASQASQAHPASQVHQAGRAHQVSRAHAVAQVHQAGPVRQAAQARQTAIIHPAAPHQAGARFASKQHQRAVPVRAAYRRETPDMGTAAIVSQERIPVQVDPSAEAPTSLAYQVPRTFESVPVNSAPGVRPVLTSQESEVSRLANGNGDRDFLMVDKALGRIILFQSGTPTYSAAALTGQSMSDRLPEGATSEKMAQLTSLDTKVTPAGRYTLARHVDAHYGALFDVNEIKGLDWGIAIHRIYLGTPSEHRAARLRSPSEDVKHITFGCINVAPDTMDLLVRELPQEGAIPVYILPEDQTRTGDYFTPRTS